MVSLVVTGQIIYSDRVHFKAVLERLMTIWIKVTQIKN
jgi:hypothetical protein